MLALGALLSNEPTAAVQVRAGVPRCCRRFSTFVWIESRDGIPVRSRDTAPLLLACLSSSDL